MNVLLTVLQGINLLFTVVIPDIAIALHIKSLFDLNPDFTVNVTTLSGDAITADNMLIANVNVWREKVGLLPLLFPTPTLVVVPGDAPAPPIVLPTQNT